MVDTNAGYSRMSLSVYGRKREIEMYAIGDYYPH